MPYIELLEGVNHLPSAPLDRGKGIRLRSESEAVETAIRLARLITNRSMVLALIDGFRSGPMGALALTVISSDHR